MKNPCKPKVRNLTPSQNPKWSKRAFTYQKTRPIFDQNWLKMTKNLTILVCFPPPKAAVTDPRWSRPPPSGGGRGSTDGAGSTTYRPAVLWPKLRQIAPAICRGLSEGTVARRVTTTATGDFQGSPAAAPRTVNRQPKTILQRHFSSFFGEKCCCRFVWLPKTEGFGLFLTQQTELFFFFFYHARPCHLVLGSIWSPSILHLSKWKFWTNFWTDPSKFVLRGPFPEKKSLQRPKNRRRRFLGLFSPKTTSDRLELATQRRKSTLRRFWVHW